MSGSALKVAICGGGVGGLVLAVALSRAPNIEVDVYEAAHEFAEIGAGVGVWPRAWKALHALGLADHLAQIAVVQSDSVPTFLFRKGDEPEGGTTFQQLITPGGMMTFHRPEFQRVLLSHLSSSCRTHTSKRLLRFEQDADVDPQSSPIRLFFQDGTTTDCDLLVGADGLKSAVRACMLEAVAAELQAQGRDAEADEALRAVRPVWSGTMAYRTTIASDVLQGRHPNHRVLATPHVYLGKNSQITTYPIARGTLVNFAAFISRYDLENTTLDAPWVQDVPREQFVSDFARWEPEVQALLECVNTSSRWAVHTTVPLQSFAHGRVLLLGDAAHAMMPYQGSGAGQAIEDAYILSALLTHPSTRHTTLPHIAPVYDTVRRPFAQRVAALSREAGLLYTLNYPGLAAAPDGGAGMLEETFERLRRNWAWAWETTAEGDLKRAVGLFEAACRPP